MSVGFPVFPTVSVGESRHVSPRMADELGGIEVKCKGEVSKLHLLEIAPPRAAYTVARRIESKGKAKQGPVLGRAIDFLSGESFPHSIPGTFLHLPPQLCKGFHFPACPLTRQILPSMLAVELHYCWRPTFKRRIKL